MVQFSCPRCSKALKAPWDAVGREVRCPRCRYRMTVPDDMPPPLSPEAVAPLPESSETRIYSEVDYRYERRNRSSELWAWLVGLPLGLAILFPILLFVVGVLACCGLGLLGNSSR